MNMQPYHLLFILKCFPLIPINTSGTARFQFQSRAEEKEDTHPAAEFYLSTAPCGCIFQKPAQHVGEASWLEYKELM